jgi:Na+-transporting NADH:ubiquinone oxidoreductase subunit A
LKTGIIKLTFLSASLLFSNAILAQSASGDTGYFIKTIGIIAGVLFLGVLLMVADNLMLVEANKAGVSKKGNFSLFPNLREIFQPKLPKGLDVPAENVTVLKKGYNMNLEGGVSSSDIHESNVSRFAIQPKNFLGLSPIPKVEVAVGDTVKAGDHLMFDKKNPTVRFTAPVSGEVIEINRGEKRSIKEIVILADKELKTRTLEAFNLEEGTREALVEYLLDSGFWPSIRQRPYHVMAEPNVVPTNIFISTFNTAPLSTDLNVIINGNENAFQKGLDVLGKLTDGKVHLGLSAKDASAAYKNATGVQQNYFYGPHPAGNVGVQIHHTDAMRTTDKVWTLDVQDVINLGNIFLTQSFVQHKVVALTGAELKEPKLVKTFAGASVAELLKDNIDGEKARVISGDVLSGQQKEHNSYLNYFDDQITVVEEGDEYEMFGWLKPIKDRPSVSGTYPNFLFADSKFKANTNTQGERRAFVLTGQYEEMLPMDILPQHLIKAIITNDYERMEGLGIHELVEEDIALAEFSCTSKQPLQKILREGLDMMIDQG